MQKIVKGMKTNELIIEIRRLPLSKRIIILEKVAQSIREHEESKVISTASEELFTDYLNDKELTSFSNLDFEDFYEAK